MPIMLLVLIVFPPFSLHLFVQVGLEVAQAL
jgi:hypothetical protein